jgi:hypothetical protein
VLARRLGQVSRQQARIDPQVGGDARHVGRLGAAGARELADPVNRVVVVERQQEAIAGTERIRLADQPQRTRRIGREDRHVLVRRGVEELQHGGTGTLAQLRARRRRRVDRVRIAEHLALQQPDVLVQLRGGEQPPAGVVEIHMAAVVEAAEVAGAQLVEPRRRGVLGMGPEELGFGDVRDAHGSAATGRRASAAVTKITPVWASKSRMLHELRPQRGEHGSSSASAGMASRRGRGDEARSSC